MSSKIPENSKSYRKIPIQPEIGLRLREARVPMGNVTQKAMADALGISQSALSDLETGKAHLNAEVLAALAQIYGLNANWLLTGEGGMFNGNHLAMAEAPTGHKTDPYPDLDTREFLLARLESLAKYIKDVWPKGTRAPKKHGKTG